MKKLSEIMAITKTPPVEEGLTTKKQEKDVVTDTIDLVAIEDNPLQRE